MKSKKKIDSNNSYVSYFDVGSLDKTPQNLQHQFLNSYTSKINGHLHFYTNEDFNSLDSQIVMRSKINEKLNIKGFVFYSMFQLCYGKAPNLDLIEEAIKLKYEIHFAIEGLVVNSKNSLDTFREILLIYYKINKQNLTLKN